MSFEIQQSNRYNYCYLIGLISTLLIGSLQFGYSLACFNPIIDIIKKIHNWDELTVTKSNIETVNIFSYTVLITALIPLGATISSFFAGSLAKN